ncbi:MAG: hypothetical protein SNJ76_08465 [Fimbriimonadaceae bacterium]
MIGNVRVGALSLTDWSPPRLLPGGHGHGWRADVWFNMGDELEVRGCRPSAIQPPHCEDLRLNSDCRVVPYDGTLPADICAHVPVGRMGCEPLF